MSYRHGTRVRNLLCASLERRTLLSSVTTDGPWHGTSCGCPGCAALDAIAAQFASANDYPPQYDTGMPASALTALDVPVHNSRPGAHAKIYLDFDGEEASSWLGTPVPVTPPFNQDGDATTFSAAEQGVISQMWARVAEKYAPFNINVTTVDPGNENLKETIHVIIGGSSTWTGGARGGIAWTDAFSTSYLSRAVYVFPGNLGNSAKNIAEAAAHEAGHALGLTHQALYSGTTLVNAYNPGNSARAPVMGNSYSATRGTWWNGQISASQAQDDISIILRTVNGFGIRPDDHGSSTGSATLPTISSSTFSSSGVVETISDNDYFRFTTTGGTVSFTAGIAQYGATLDLTLELRDASNNLISSANTSTLGETLSASVSAGTYYIVVASAGNYGDIGQYTLSATIPTTPAVLTVDAGSGYTVGEGSSISLAALVLTGSASSFAWDLDGDGIYGETGVNAARGTETGQNVTFDATGLDGPSSFVVSLRATAADASTATDTATISITNEAPTFPAAAPTSNPLYEGSEFTLSFSVSDPGNDTISAWLINWGDGTTTSLAGTATTAAKTYADNGTYTITLTATDEDGSYSTTRLVTVTNVAPTLSLSADSSVNEGSSLSVSFSASDPGADTVSSWLINWGDGTTTTYAASATGGSKTYADNGTYTITLTATDEDGSYTTTRSVTVLNVAPTLTLSAASSVNEGSSLSVSFSATDPGTDSVTSWLINWGDGTTTTYAASATGGSKTYADNGTYTITLTATDGDGSYTTTRSVTVLNISPTLTLSASSTVNEAASLSVSFSATDPGTDTVSSWLINWGDGTTTTYAASATDGSKTYADNGTYTITLTATDEDGTHTTTRSVTVLNVSPTLSLSAASTVNEGSSLSVSFSATDPGTDTVSSWLVNWGDGTTTTYAASATSGSKTYADNGTYTITLTATDEDSSYSTTRSVTVANVAPTLNLSASATVNEGSSLSVSFSATDPGADSVTSWLVNWGDGTTTTYAASATGGSKTYADNGAYTITLTGTDGDGSYTTTRSVTVLNVAPAITWSPASSVAQASSLSTSWTVSDPGSDTLSNWLVNWGDGTTTSLAGTARSASKTYLTAGVYTLTLTATDEDGSYSVTSSVTVTANAPNIVLVPSATTIDEGDTLELSFSAPNRVGSLSAWRIDWGDGTIETFAASASTASHRYDDNATVTLSVTAIEPDLTETTSTLNIVINNVPPTITVSGSAELIDVGESFVLTVSGPSPLGAPVAEWIVDWGDGTSDTYAGNIRLFSTTYETAGTYQPTVTAVDGEGNTATLAGAQVSVLALPTAVIGQIPTITSETSQILVSVTYWTPSLFSANDFNSQDLQLGNFGSGISVSRVSATTSDGGHTWIVTYAINRSNVWTWTDDGTRTIGLRAGAATDDLNRASVANSVNVTMLARPNDQAGFDLATARQLGNFEHGKVKNLSDAIGPWDKNDFFRMRLMASSILNIKLSNLSSTADVRVYNGLNQLVGESRRGGASNEYLTLNLTGGYYYVRVFDSRGTGTYYNLRVEAARPPTPPSPVGQPGQEPDSNGGSPTDLAGNDLSSARQLGEFTPGRAKNLNDSIGPYDKNDFYRLKASKAGVLQIKLSDLSSTADIRVYHGTGELFAEARSGGISNEYLSIPVTGGWYYVRVFDRAGSGTTYSLRIAIA